MQSSRPQLVPKRRAPAQQQPVHAHYVQHQIPVNQVQQYSPVYQQQYTPMPQPPVQQAYIQQVPRVQNNQSLFSGSAQMRDLTVKAFISDDDLEKALSVVRGALGIGSPGVPSCMNMFNMKINKGHPLEHVFSSAEFKTDVEYLYYTTLGSKYSDLTLGMVSVSLMGNKPWTLVMNYKSTYTEIMVDFRKRMHALIKKHIGAFRNEGKRIYTKSGFNYTIYSQGGIECFAISEHHSINSEWKPYINIFSEIDARNTDPQLPSVIQNLSSPMTLLVNGGSINPSLRQVILSRHVDDIKICIK